VKDSGYLYHLRWRALATAIRQKGGNAYNLGELAGAFGDLGTLIPFLVGYITLSHMDPVGVLVSFGLCKICAGLYFKTPVPIQPMKAIGTAAISHAGALSVGAIWAAGLFSGVFWLVMGLTGAVSWIAKITSRPVVLGIIMGLGLEFIREGVKMMGADPLLAVSAAVLTFLLLSHERIPAMLVLLGLGAVVALVAEPTLLSELGRLSFHFRVPTVTVTKLSHNELLTGVLVLGLPQVALTLGNAIIATVEENNAVFPHHPITVKAVAIDHGIMNVVGSSLGGVPMCHGAGGMAAHVRFGARTGGALVMLGSIMLVLGLFFADSIATFLKLFPPALLGVILMFGGLELAAGVQGNHAAKEDRYVMFLTAGVASWNMGVGYLVGLLLWYAFQRGWLKA
jgi:MFS superfamily sulfate permease-like transporter